MLTPVASHLYPSFVGSAVAGSEGQRSARWRSAPPNLEKRSSLQFLITAGDCTCVFFGHPNLAMSCRPRFQSTTSASKKDNNARAILALE